MRFATAACVATLATLVAGCASSTSSTPTDVAADTGTSDVPLADMGLGDTSIPPSGGVVLLKTTSELCDKVAGLSADMMLAGLKPEYKADFTSKRDSSVSKLTLKLVYNKGEIRCHPMFDPGTGGAPVMPAWLEVVVSLSYSTADGALAEVAPQAILQKKFGPNLEVFTTLSSKDIKGTFKPIEMPGYDLIDFQLGGDLLADGSTSGILQQIGSKTGSPSGPHMTFAAGTWK